MKSVHLMPKRKNKLIFVYNANSSLFALGTDYVHKIISPQTYQCDLCKITYGNLGMRKEWKEFIQKLPITVQFLHKDEFIKNYLQFTHFSFPAVFRGEGSISQLITAEEINKQRTLTDLKNLVQAKANSIYK